MHVNGGDIDHGSKSEFGDIKSGCAALSVVPSNVVLTRFETSKARFQKGL